MKPVLDFIQRTERKTGESGARVDFIQRETAISAEMDESGLARLDKIQWSQRTLR